MPEFLISWQSKRGNDTQIGEMPAGDDVLGERTTGYYEEKIGKIRSYWNYVTKNVRYRIVLASRRYNMTNEDIWDAVKSWKEEALQRKLFTCVSDLSLIHI